MQGRRQQNISNNDRDILNVSYIDIAGGFCNMTKHPVS